MKNRAEEIKIVVSFLEENGFKEDRKGKRDGFLPLHPFVFFKTEGVKGPICDCSERMPQLLCYVYDDERFALFRFNMWAEKNGQSYESHLYGHDADKIEDAFNSAKRAFEAGWKALEK